MFKFSLDTKSIVHLPRLEKKLNKSTEHLENEKKRNQIDEFIIQNSSDVQINSNDNLILNGHYWDNQKKTNRYALLCHGYNGSPAEMLKIGQNYLEQGFNLLFIDQRTRGKSQGRYCTMSVKESEDVKCWVDYLVKKDSGAQIVMHGVSMGAAAIMNSLVLDLPQNVKFVVEDCGFTSLWDEYSMLCNKMFHLPAFPFMQFTSLAARFHAHISYHQGNCKNAVSKSKIPVVFAHGTNDEVVPFYMQDILYNSANCVKEKIVVEGAGHTKACNVNPQLYFSVVNKFIQQYITE